MKAATPFPLEANGRSVALTGMIPSNRANTRIKLLIVTKRFMMISLISIQIWAVTELTAALHFEVVNNRRTSHPIFKLFIAGWYEEFTECLAQSSLS